MPNETLKKLEKSIEAAQLVIEKAKRKKEKKPKKTKLPVVIQ